jgi:norsolorinic acid ketoreductase
MSAKTVYFITGANRGIGKGFVEAYASRPDTVVVAATRDPSSASSKALSAISTGKGSKIIVVKLDAARENDAQEAVEELKTTHGINYIDTVIASAGISNYWGPTITTPASAFQEHFNINTIGTIKLFQATNQLLERSSSPKFVYISSVVGSIGDLEKWPLPGVAVGASKAVMNYIVRKIHIEHPQLTVFPIHPGWVQTDMGNDGAVANGLEEAPVTLKDSIDGMISKVWLFYPLMMMYANSSSYRLTLRPGKRPLETFFLSMASLLHGKWLELALLYCICMRTSACGFAHNTMIR